jgi:hypothetical protein
MLRSTGAAFLEAQSVAMLVGAERSIVGETQAYAN